MLLNWKINSLFARDLPRVGRSDFNERDRLCDSSFPGAGEIRVRTEKKNKQTGNSRRREIKIV